MAAAPGVAEPAVAPAPPAASTVEKQHIAVAARALENSPKEIEVSNTPLLVEPFESDMILLLPKSKGGLGAKKDVVTIFQAFELLFACDTGLTLLEAGVEDDLGEVHLFDFQFGPLIALGLDDLPARADKGHRIETPDHSQDASDDLQNQLARKETANAVFTAELIDHCFHRSPLHLRILHDHSPSDC